MSDRLQGAFVDLCATCGKNRFAHVPDPPDGYWPECVTFVRPAAIDAAHLDRQREWSRHTFGPGSRLLGVLDHIRKELAEIEANPTDVTEWVDVIILAFDGAWRAGWEPQQILDAIEAKQTRNEQREWPDWRTMSPDQAIEHVRSEPAAIEVPTPETGGPSEPTPMRCTTPGCDGDGRYSAPGRGHITSCRYPLPEPAAVPEAERAMCKCGHDAWEHNGRAGCAALSGCPCNQTHEQVREPAAVPEVGAGLSEEEQDAICEALAVACTDSTDANVGVSANPLYAAVERILATRAGRPVPMTDDQARAFLAEWTRPYFGPDAHDALARVRRAAAHAGLVTR